mmetsp:Transcript_339/g.792  ORF Transcript_339/g.792 Transcript_339/m.792 type:complete len:211 (+) Transcript_339:1177-1809(+)
MGRERSGCLVHLRGRYRGTVPAQARSGSHLPRPSSRRGWVRILRPPSARHPLLRAELLRRVRQRRCHDERRRDAHVLLPNPQASREEATLPVPGWRPRTAGNSTGPSRRWPKLSRNQEEAAFTQTLLFFVSSSEKANYHPPSSPHHAHRQTSIFLGFWSHTNAHALGKSMEFCIKCVTLPSSGPFFSQRNPKKYAHTPDRTKTKTRPSFW